MSILEKNDSALKSQEEKLSTAISKSADQKAVQPAQQPADQLQQEKVDVSPILANLKKQLPKNGQLQQFDYGKSGDIKCPVCV